MELSAPVKIEGDRPVHFIIDDIWGMKAAFADIVTFFAPWVALSSWEAILQGLPEKALYASAVMFELWLMFDVLQLVFFVKIIFSVFCHRQVLSKKAAKPDARQALATTSKPLQKPHYLWRW